MIKTGNDKKEAPKKDTEAEAKAAEAKAAEAKAAEAKAAEAKAAEAKAEDDEPKKGKGNNQYRVLVSTKYDRLVCPETRREFRRNKGTKTPLPLPLWIKNQVRAGLLADEDE